MSLDFVIPMLNINGDENTQNQLQFYRKGFYINSGYSPTWQDVTVSGNDYVNLPNAKADGLNYLKLYGGCEQRRLPEGYTELASISGTVYKTWFDTGVAGNNNNLRFVFSGYKSQAAGYNAFFGNYIDEETNVTRLIAGPFSNGIIAEINRASQGSTITNSINYLVVHTYELYKENGNSILKVDGVQVESMADLAGTANSTNIAINSSKTNPSTLTSAVITTFQGDFKIYNGTTLIRNYVMAKRDSDNAVGMYDTVNDTFKISEGIESFTAGPEATPTPTPSNPLSIWCNNGELKVRNRSGLPLGYTKLDYIEATSTQYINTGIMANDNTDIGIVASGITTPSAQIFVAGASSGSGFTTLRIVKFSADELVGVSNGATKILSNSIGVTKFKAELINKTFYLDGVSFGSFTNTINPEYTLELFRGKYGTEASAIYYSAFKCHSAYVKQNGVLVLNLVPAKRNSDNVLGMYDTVTDTFFTNAGTGTFTAGPVDDSVEIYTDGTVETVEMDTTGDTATAEMLLGISTYKDVQSVIDGEVTRNVGVKVLTGAESWSYHSLQQGNMFRIAISDSVSDSKNLLGVLCNSYKVVSSDNRTNNTLSGFTRYYDFIDDNYTTLDAWKTHVTQQFTNGTPIVVVYPISTPTTETVTGQPLTIQEGSNTIEITQASISPLSLEANYKAGVSVTITEVENANLDNSVTVTIS